MPGYSEKREQNYEIKYLRKVLGQVDSRILVPPGLDARALLPLIDDIEPQALRAAPRRRPRWLSLQSGIAYAAAFALVVALFYSMEIYRPQVLHGGMTIEEQTPPPAAAKTAEDAVVPEAAPAEERVSAPDDAGAGAAVHEAAPVAVAEESAAAEQEPEPAGLGVGGIESTLLLEDGDASYYCRLNDPADPDSQAPVTLEVINRDSMEYVARLEVPEMDGIENCFVLDDRILLVGQDEDSVVISVYDNTNPAEPDVISSFDYKGEFLVAGVYKDTIHVISAGGDADNAVTLPNASSEDSLSIIAYNTETGESNAKTFIGAKGEAQLHGLGAYIYYEGKNENGETDLYIAQILLDGMDIELSSVS